MTKYNTTTLQNGLRVIHLPTTASVVYCGYQVAAGTRHELPGEEGMAHFCEHITFKGTARRNALQVINAIEGVGGELNAFTNKEDTTYYAAIQREHIWRAIDVLSDIVFDSRYPQEEIDKEVEVICDEIESYNDSPAELIYDEFENLIFCGHPLGHNILGQAERLRTFTTADALRFTKRHYRPDNMVFFASGDIDFRQLVRRLEKEQGARSKEQGAGGKEQGAGSKEQGARGKEQKDTPSSENPQDKSLAPCTLPLAPCSSPHHRHLGTHQAHVMVGCRAYDSHHPQRITLYLLNNLLGGPGLNARLSISLRERRGLVYTVESTMCAYSDTGLWSVYFGCDPHDVKRCLRLVHHELDRVVQRPLSDRQLTAAKRQLKGQIAIACDNREQFALDFGKSFLHYGKEKNIDELFARIDAVTATDVQQVATELFAPSRLQTLIYD